MRKLPTRIEIIGNEITIEQADDHYERTSSYGEWVPKENTIRMQSLKKGFPKDVIFATYGHEVIHAILDLTGHADLSSDEAFVERVGQAIYQAEKSRKYA